MREHEPLLHAEAEATYGRDVDESRAPRPLSDRSPVEQAQRHGGPLGTEAREPREPALELGIAEPVLVFRKTDGHDERARVSGFDVLSDHTPCFEWRSERHQHILHGRRLGRSVITGSNAWSVGPGTGVGRILPHDAEVRKDPGGAEQREQWVQPRFIVRSRNRDTGRNLRFCRIEIFRTHDVALP